MDKLKYTGYLFSTPSFVKGIAKAIDLGDTLNNYNEASSSEEADKKAFKADADALMNDMKIAFGKLKKECING